MLADLLRIRKVMTRGLRVLPMRNTLEVLAVCVQVWCTSACQVAYYIILKSMKFDARANWPLYGGAIYPQVVAT
jgi:hypothetical protein